MKTEKRAFAVWITVEAEEVIELKRITLDRDATEAVDFFHTVIAPQLIAAAERFGINRAGIKDEEDGRLPR